MKILLTNQHLYRPGGSETACYTLAVELIRQGHEVFIYTPHPGEVSDRMKAAGAKWVVPGHYDRVICSHWPTQKHVRENAHITYSKLIRVCHGTIPDLEQPIPGADAYVSISEEVQAHLKAKGYESTVIRNGVDCERFKPAGEPEAGRVLSLCQSDKANNLLAEACRLAGKQLVTLNKFTNPAWNVERYINQAEIVVSLGRGALEAMACNRPVIVWDWRDYNGNLGDGIMTLQDVSIVSMYNFSGRAFNRKPFSAQVIADLIKGVPYLAESGDLELRWWVLKNANIEHQARKYLDYEQN